MIDMPTALLMELRDVFNTRFDSEGLAMFIQAFGVDPENIPGNTRAMKALNFAKHLWQHDRLTDLLIIGPRERPDIDWVAILEPHGIVLPNSDPTPAHVSYNHLQALVPIVAGRPMFLTPEGRQTMLSLAGVADFVRVNLNGSTHDVAASVLDQLNRYGETQEGDNALGRFLVYLTTDPSLPPAHLTAIDTIIDQYDLRSQANSE